MKTPARQTTAPNHALDVVNAWLARKQPGTNAAYIDCYHRVQQVLAGRPLMETDPLLLVDLLYARGYAPATVELTVHAMSSLWGDLMRAGLVDQNPWVRLPLRPAKDTRMERYLTEDEVTRLIESASSLRNKTFLRFLYGTGMRVSEAVGVTWGDLRRVEDGRWFLTVLGKGRKTRVIVVPPRVVGYLQILHPHPQPAARIFPMTRQRAWEIIRATARRAGIDKDVSPHWFRHAHATHAMNHGAPIHVVQHSLGHASIDTTAGYLHTPAGESSMDYLPPVK